MLKSESDVSEGHIDASSQLNSRMPGTKVSFRFRHPQGKLFRSVTLNRKSWSNFDANDEWVSIPNAENQAYSIAANYQH